MMYRATHSGVEVRYMTCHALACAVNESYGIQPITAILNVAPPSGAIY